MTEHGTPADWAFTVLCSPFFWIALVLLIVVTKYAGVDLTPPPKPPSRATKAILWLMERP